MMRGFFDDRDLLPWLISGLGILCVGLLIVAAVLDHQWSQWADQHCRKIGEVSGSVGVGPTVNGNGTAGVTTVYIPGKTGYRCDDGQEYWR